MNPLILLLILVFGGLGASPGHAYRQNLGEHAYFYDGEHPRCHQVAHQLPSSEPPWINEGWYQRPFGAFEEYRQYCVRIAVDIEAPVNQPLMLVGSFLASATLYWDGEALAEKGVPAADKEQEIAGPLTVASVLHRDQLEPGRHWLTMQLSSFGHREDLHQVVYSLRLYDVESTLEHNYQNLFTLVLVGGMLLLWVVFLLIYKRYENSAVYAIFAWLCLMAGALLVLELMKYYWNYPWTFHIIRLRIIIPTVIATGLLLVAYYLAWFEFVRKWRYLLLCALCFAVVGWFAPSYDLKSLLIFFLALLFSTLVAARAWRRGVAGAKLHTGLLTSGLVALFILPFQFIDQWFAALFSLMALANLYSMSAVFRRDRERALRAVALEAELLRRQLQPHFLMNSLTLLSEWIETEPDQAIEMIDQLADEFRLLNQMSKANQVPWQDELALCRLHFDIMKARYQKEIHLTVHSDCDDFLIPPAIIHSLIENVFAHNRLCDGDRVALRVRCTALRVSIECRSPLRSQATARQGTGTGGRYIQSRLQQSFGRDWSYSSHALEEGVAQQHQTLWVSRVEFPRRRIPSDRGGLIPAK